MNKKVMTCLFIMISILFINVYADGSTIEVIGVNNDYPYMYLDKNGEASGLVIDLLKDYAKTTEEDIDFSLYKPEEAAEMFVKRGDILYFGDFIDERISHKESVPLDIKNFHIYYNKNNENNLKKVQTFYEDIELISSAKVGIRSGQKNSTYVRKLAELEKLSVYDDYSSLLKDLDAGVIDIGVLPFYQSNHLITLENYKNIELFETPVFYKKLTFKSKSTKILDTLSIYIINDKKIGKIADAHKYWFESNVIKNTGSKSILYFNVSLAALVIMLLSMVIWNNTLQKRVAERTTDLETALDENKQLYESVIQKEKFKNDYFMNLSHELRTPLNIILSAVQLNENYLREEDFDRIIQNAGSYTDIIRNNSYRLLRVVNNLIDINKIETGSYKLNIDYVDIVFIAEKIVKSIIPFTTAKGLKIKLTSEFDELFVECDPFEIERVILNLLSNAIKFTDVGGSISIQIVKNDIYKEVVISVKDTGVGILKENQKRIFEKYRQENSDLTRNNEGNGLGLSLVSSIIEMHGGSINLFSELGKGSEFIVHLPLQTKYKGVIDKRKDFVYQLHSQDKRVNLELADLESVDN